MIANNKKNVLLMPKQVKESDADRFWGKVIVKENKDECWKWNGRVKDGYGQFKFGRIVYVAHRVSYFLHYGIDPLDSLCCHSCDVKNCVNPNHIFLGTQGDNYNDAVNKNRATMIRGCNHMNAKLTEADVFAMIEEYRVGNISQSELGQKYGVSSGYVDLVLKGKTWKYLNIEPIKTKKPLRIKLNESKVKEIIADCIYKKLSYSIIAAKYGITASTVCGIVRGKSWKSVNIDRREIDMSNGEQNHSAKITKDSVLYIREKYSQGKVPYKKLSQEYGINQESIRRIIKGITWKHLLYKSV